MSRQRTKGTKWESELLELLRAAFPHAERAPLEASADGGDFVSVGDWLLEAKSTVTPRFLDWARTCRSKGDRHGRRWAVLWHGDRRSERGQPLVVLALDTFLELCSTDMDTAPNRSIHHDSLTVATST